MALGACVPLRVAAGHGDHRSGCPRRRRGVPPQDRLGPLARAPSTWCGCACCPGRFCEDWADVAPRLAQTFGDAGVPGPDGCRPPPRPRALVPRRGPADRPRSRRSTPVEATDPKALPVAVREDGLTYRLRLLGTHLLVVGATGSGKGSVLWSIIAALAPAIRDRTAQVWALDPKGGMELAAGRAAVRAVRLRRPRGRDAPTRPTFARAARRRRRGDAPPAGAPCAG